MPAVHMALLTDTAHQVQSRQGTEIRAVIVVVIPTAFCVRLCYIVPQITPNTSEVTAALQRHYRPASMRINPLRGQNAFGKPPPESDRQISLRHSLKCFLSPTYSQTAVHSAFHQNDAKFHQQAILGLIHIGI